MYDIVGASCSVKKISPSVIRIVHSNFLKFTFFIQSTSELADATVYTKKKFTISAGIMTVTMVT